MNNRLVTYMTAAMVAAVLILFILNMLPLIQPSSIDEKWIKLNDVKGVEIYHKQIPYTLNFDQQSQLINFINRSEPATENAGTTEFPFEKLIIYQFNHSNEEFKPVALHDDQLIFLISGRQLKSKEPRFYQFLTTTYDP